MTAVALSVDCDGNNSVQYNLVLDNHEDPKLKNKTIYIEEITEQIMNSLISPVSTIFLPSFYMLVCSISVPINICAVLALAQGIHAKKPPAIYMMNLSVADVLFAIMLPFKISYYFEGNNWKFGSFMCSVVTAAFYWNTFCSVLLIACISVDRLLAVVYPIDSLTWRSPQKAVIACVTMWILSFAGSVPLVTFDQTFHIRELNITTCHDFYTTENIMWVKNYFLILCCTLFFLPLLITVVSYTWVVWSLSRQQNGDPGRSRRRRRAVVMALMVLVVFVLCFMPTNCLLLAHYVKVAHYVQLSEEDQENQEPPNEIYDFYLVFQCLGSVNCLLDPLLYYFGSSQYQRQLSNMLKCQNGTKCSEISPASFDLCTSNARKIMKSSHTESIAMDPSVTKVDSVQAKLNGQNEILE